MKLFRSKKKNTDSEPMIQKRETNFFESFFLAILLEVDRNVSMLADKLLLECVTVCGVRLLNRNKLRRSLLDQMNNTLNHMDLLIAESHSNRDDEKRKTREPREQSRSRE